MTNDSKKPVSAEVLEDDLEMTLTELCKVCGMSSEKVVELVEYGVIEPLGQQPSSWRFQAVSLRRIRRARRLEIDLGVNAAGAALALDLLEELEQLRIRLHRFDQLHDK